jgi:WD40 repeat protein
LDAESEYFEKENEGEPEFNYVICQFHKAEVTGLDVCVRKQLIATCSLDKTVCIWNYETRQLEIRSNPFTESFLAVAFHPSGLHLLVACSDKIQICNVLSRKIDDSIKSLPVKGCSEVRFSHGGHLFACTTAQSNKEIHIYNFYTLEITTNMQFSGSHTNRIRSIAWFENDMGFASTGIDGNIYFFNLYSGSAKENGKRDENYDYLQKDNKFACLSTIPGSSYDVLAVGSDKMIHNNNGREVKGNKE